MKAIGIFVRAAVVVALVASGAAAQQAKAAATPPATIPATAAAPASSGAPKDVPQPAHPAQVAQSQAEAQRLSDAFVAVADRVSQSVVQIDVTARDENADQVMRWMGRGDSPVARGTGSGVIFTPDGAILTNNHVIEEALTIAVKLRDGRYLPAKLLGRDPETDLAVVKVDATGLVPAKFADSDVARVGEWVVAIGSPYGLGYTVTAGILSAKGRGNLGMNAIEDFLQTDASINPGNSGGPLCDLDGKVLGINSMIVAARSGGASIGFAVPANMARRVADQILKTGHVERSSVGVVAQDLTPELASAFKLDVRAGALVDSISKGGPAEKANMKPGDVIAAVAGHPVHDARDLIREVLSHDVGQALQLEIIRDGKHYAASVTLSARPEEHRDPVPVQQQGVPHAGLGMSVRDIVAPQAGQAPYTAITDVVPGSAADRASLKRGDVIVEADGKLYPTSDDVQKAAADGELLLRVERRGGAFYAALHK